MKELAKVEESTVSPKVLHIVQRIGDMVYLFQLIAQGEYTFQNKVPLRNKILKVFSPLGMSARQTVLGLFRNHLLKKLPKVEGSTVSPKVSTHVHIVHWLGDVVIFT